MSADNWAECPKCGKGSNPDYSETPLREDYEIGIYPRDTFFIHYKGECQECGFVKKFDHKEKLNP